MCSACKIDELEDKNNGLQAENEKLKAELAELKAKQFPAPEAQKAIIKGCIIAKDVAENPVLLRAPDALFEYVDKNSPFEEYFYLDSSKVLFDGHKAGDIFRYDLILEKDPYSDDGDVWLIAEVRNATGFVIFPNLIETPKTSNPLFPFKIEYV